jgi:hypothetical protein
VAREARALLNRWRWRDGNDTARHARHRALARHHAPRPARHDAARHLGTPHCTCAMALSLPMCRFMLRSVLRFVLRFMAMLLLQRMFAVYAGHHHAALLDRLGNLFMWGSNGSGRLGLGHRGGCGTPTAVDALSTIAIRQVSMGRSHSAAVSAGSDLLYVWGCAAEGKGCVHHSPSLNAFPPCARTIVCRNHVMLWTRRPAWAAGRGSGLVRVVNMYVRMRMPSRCNSTATDAVRRVVVCRSQGLPCERKGGPGGRRVLPHPDAAAHPDC